MLNVFERKRDVGISRFFLIVERKEMKVTLKVCNCNCEDIK